MKIIIRRFLITLVGFALLLDHRAMAQDAPAPPPPAQTRAAAAPRGDWAQPAQPTPDITSDVDPSVVGEHQIPVGGVFGDTPPAACEFCGGGGCLPPTWTVETSLAMMSLSRPNNERFGANSLPAGPLPAGSISFTSSNGITTSNVYTQYLNDAIQTSALETHTPSVSNSPSLGITLTRFLGRDGESRDHFLDFTFNGLQSYAAAMTVHGTMIPFYQTEPDVQTIPAIPPTALYYQGSLISPAPIYLPVDGRQQQLIQPAFSTLGRIYDEAFNRSDTMSTSFTATFNELEVNYRFAGHNQPDQLVMNPNGRWYRECQTGYYYSYYFGLKMMIINETFDFQSSGSQYASINNGDGTFSPAATPEFLHQGEYYVQTYNNMVGAQTGGKLEYRFCRWCLDTHGNVGMFMNFAHQYSHITTSFVGTPDPASSYITPTNTDNAFDQNNTGVAFAGGFGVTGSYKFLPNLIGHVSYDMLWVGDVARASEQVIFSSVPETSRNLINTQGSVFYNGVSLAAEWDW